MKIKVSATVIFELGLLLILVSVLICSLATGRLEIIPPLIVFIAMTIGLLFLESWLSRQGIYSGWYYPGIDDNADLSDLVHSPPWPIIKRKIELLSPAVLYNMKISPPEKTVGLTPGIYELMSFEDSLWWENEEGSYGLSPVELEELITNGQAHWV